MYDKKALRAQRLAERKAWSSKKSKSEVERSLNSALKAFLVEHHAQCVAVYVAIRGEPSLQTLYSNLSITWAFPQCHGQDLVFAKAEQWRKGAFGIPEPIGAVIDPQNLDWVLVPCLALSPQGYRLGYGGGFYDRWLQGHPYLKPKTIGIVEKAGFGRTWKSDPWDISMSYWASEQGIQRF